MVGSSDSARAFALSDRDAFPDVFATSRMIALMELAAARGMTSLLEPGQLSVGVSVAVKHLAATPVGTEVRAVATFLGEAVPVHRTGLRSWRPDRRGRARAGNRHASRLERGPLDRIDPKR